MQDLIVTMTKGELEKLFEDRLRYCLLTYVPLQPAPPGTDQQDPNQLLTKKEAARLLGVSPSTIDNHARAGNLTRLYIGKSVRFSREQVTSLAQGKTPRTPGQPLLKRAKRKG